MTDVTWPGGLEDFYYRIKINAGQIVLGTIIALDPASGSASMPGFAVFRAGELVKSGTLPIPKRLPIEKRLPILYEKVRELTEDVPSILAIEKLRGRAVNTSLAWAVGTSIAAARAPTLIEVPIIAWQRLAKTDSAYVKGDEADAIKLGQTLVLLAQEYLREHPQSLPARPKS